MVVLGIDSLSRRMKPHYYYIGLMLVGVCVTYSHGCYVRCHVQEQTTTMSPYRHHATRKHSPLIRISRL